MSIALFTLGLACLAQAPPTARVVMPASGVVVDGLPLDDADRWEAEGTVEIGSRNSAAIDRLLGWRQGRRRITIEVRRQRCPPRPAPGTTSPWPRLGYSAIRHAAPDRRAVTSCKAPDLMLELRFVASPEDEDLLTRADRWEPTVAALHQAYTTTRVDLGAAIAGRDRLSIEVAADGPPGGLTGPLKLRDGRAMARVPDRAPWLVRDLGGYDHLQLAAPTGAGVSLQLLPVRPRYSCDQALEAALRSQPPAAPGAQMPGVPTSWEIARPIGANNMAWCARGERGGMVVIGVARVSREEWLPVATPLVERLGGVVVDR